MANEETKSKKNQNRANDGYDTVHEVDPIGYWDEEAGPCYFTPKHARVFDGNIDSSKPSVLIFGTLNAPTQCYTGKGDEQTEVPGKAGDFIAVWGKPGMAALADKCDVPVKLYQEGEKDTGKPNAMKLYKVVTKGNDFIKKNIPIKEDTRDKSFGVTTFLEPKIGKRQSQQRAGVPSSGTSDADDSEIPF